MSARDHWHAVLPSRDLKTKPVGVTVAGEEVVLFRTAGGKIGALQDKCPHRRMRLSKGWVEGNRVVCPYHGWNYDREGRGHSPSTPNREVCAVKYDVTERHEAIWVKPSNVDAVFPEFVPEGFSHVCTVHHRIEAPLELTVDNFVEIEHSVTSHVILAYDREGIAATETKVETYDDAVRILNKGRQRDLPWVLRKAMGFEPGDDFMGDGWVRFSPVNVVIENYWVNPDTKERRSRGTLGVVFFNPVNDDATDIMVFFFAASDLLERSKLISALTKPVTGAVLKYELILDQRMIGALADKDPKIQGMKLGRFDKPLGAIRTRIDRLYRGKTAAASTSQDGPIPISVVKTAAGK